MASPHDALSLEDRPGPAVLRPLRDAFHLPALDASVATARRRVTERLRAWHVDEECCQDAELLVSELFTNAVRHTASKKVGCELWMIGVRLRVEVTDQGGARRPFPPHPSGVLDMNGEYGRGLLLVGALAEEWGIRAEGPGGEPGGAGLGSATEAEEGHAVWAELHCTRRRRD